MLDDKDEKIEEEIEFETFQISPEPRSTNDQQAMQDFANDLKKQLSQTLHQLQFSKTIDLYAININRYYGGIKISFLKIKIQRNSIQLIGTITQQNGLKIKVRSKIMRLSIMKYCLRLNSTFRYGAFCLGKENEIQFKLNFRVLDKDLILLKQEKLLKEYLKASIVTQQSTLRFHIHRQLYLSNYLDVSNFKIIDERPEQYRKLPNNFESVLSEIKDMIMKSNKQDQALFQKKQNYFTYPKQPKPQKILTKIIIDENQDFTNAQQINEGGFAIIKKQEITFTVEGEQTKIKKQMVIKQIRDQDPQKLKHEIGILKYLNSRSQNKDGVQFDGVCTHIAAFYYSEQEAYKDFLFSDLMFHQSLDSFKSKKQEQFSIQSRIYIMYGVSLALYYLHQYGVAHLDLKPANILISKSLIPKLIDFGEAQYRQMNTANIPGRTLPYAAPEMFRSNSNNIFPPSYDIYAFGIMLYDILMDRFPLEFKRSDSNNLQAKEKNGKITYKLNEQAFLERGPKDFMILWLELIKRCLNDDPKERPHIQNIVIILRESLQMIDLLY